MFARVTTFQGLPEQQDEATRYACEHVIPTLQRSTGFKGFYWLGDPQGGKALVVTLWEDEETLRASEDQASHLRTSTDQAVGSTAEDIARYQVMVHVGVGNDALSLLPND